MVEKTGGHRRMGQERWKYLDLANMSFAAGDYVSSKGYLDAFLETIPDDTEAGKKIKTEFDHIEINRCSLRKQLDEEAKDLGYLEQADVLNNGRRQIEIDAIYNQKTVCWTVAMEYGLFNA